MTDSHAQVLAYLNDSTAPAPSLADALHWANDLKKAGDFALGEAFCGRFRETRPKDFAGLSDEERDIWRKLRQRQALFTYKDLDRRRVEACETALAVLDEDPSDETLATSTDHETLGLAGAIWKRRWEIERRLADLERSAHYYLCGWRQTGPDQAYNGINAAFVLDCLAAQMDMVDLAGIDERGKPLRDQATSIRRQILDDCQAAAKAGGKAPNWWDVVTALEAAVGLGDQPAAMAWLSRAAELSPSDWEWQSTAVQLAALVDLLSGAAQDAGLRVLQAFVGDKAPGLLEKPRAKLGLALSGGGFRASIFHLGVLAALAEADLLRHVQVLSCVSGGSIVGAAFYLRLLELAEEKDDAADRQDYLRLVEALIQDFHWLTTKNDVRTRAVLGWGSTTVRIGRLLEELLYLRIRPGKGLAPEDLLYRPGAFRPRRDNWRRRCKLPELVINATALNTGHTWQYTASWMGEAPFALEPDIDVEERLRRLYHREAPENFKPLSLPEAVAASAAVPPLLPSISLEGLYPHRTVRLSDGGVADNQGLFSLDEQDCTLMIVSDASKPTAAEADPGFHPALSLLRLSDLLMNAIRRFQYRIARTQKNAGRLADLVFVHLSDGLPQPQVDWLGASWRKPPRHPAQPLNHGIPADIQRALSRLRTDLDRFHPDEFDSLALAGYRMTRARLAASKLLNPGPAHAWSFADIGQRWTPGANGHTALLRVLKAGEKRKIRLW